MIKVMLVDDEPIIRQGLSSSFDWNANGFTVVAEASNGSEALKKFNTYRPEIVITDVRMPKCDGIEFMKQLKSIQADTEIIVLSGYDEFEYAKEAMDAGAFKYLLKPINLNSFVQTMSELSNKIQKQKKVINAQLLYDSVQTEKLIMSIIANPEKASEIDYNSIDFSGKLSGDYFVCVLNANYTELSNNSLLNMALRLKECIEYMISTSENYILKIQLTQTKYILTIFLKSTHTYESAIVSLNKMLKTFRADTGLGATIGISGIFRKLKLISSAYKQAESALEHGDKTGDEGIIDYIELTDGANQHCYISTKEIESIARLIQTESYADAIKAIDTYLTRVGKETSIQLNKVKSNIAELAIRIINNTAANTDIMQMIFGRVIKPVAELEKLSKLNEVRDWIYNLIETVKNSSSIYKKEIKNENVKKAIQYIISQYNKHLTLENVANQLYISPRHLMRCFKSETGITFNDYLTNYRMDKAVQLFKTGKYKIYEVALLVGYTDSKYFCTQFKKITGMKPGDI